MRLEPPSPIATVQITAAMPIVMPSIVSAVRSLLRASAVKRDRKNRGEIHAVTIPLRMRIGQRTPPR